MIYYNAKVKFIEDSNHSPYITFKKGTERTLMIDEEENVFFMVHCCTKKIIPKSTYKIIEKIKISREKNEK